MSNFSLSIFLSALIPLFLIPENAVVRKKHTQNRMDEAACSFYYDTPGTSFKRDAISRKEIPVLTTDEIQQTSKNKGEIIPLKSESPLLRVENHTLLDSPQYKLEVKNDPPDSILNPNDRIGDATTQEYVSPMWLQNPSNIETKYELAPDGKGYYIYEQINGINIRPPSYISFEDYLEMRRKQGIAAYFKETGMASNKEQQKSLIPSIELAQLNDVFGGGTISLTPTGSASLQLSVDRNKIENPSLPLRQQKNTYLNFDQQLQAGVVGNIGDKFKVNISQDTKATFDFENITKLDYTGDEDQILQRLETGNVSMPLGNSLIQGAQNLFGIKAGLKFGPVNVIGLMSMDRGQRQTISAQGSGQGGTIETQFKKSIADYDQNRHFFLSHYFRSKFDEALARVPQINSRVIINQLEVWVTNPNVTQTSNLRLGVGFIDMGENDKKYANGQGVLFNPNVISDNDTILPDKGSNNLYKYLKNNPDLRDKAKTANILESGQFRMVNGVDFQLVNLRKLQEGRDYTYHPQLGYVSLSTPLQSDDVMFVSYSYQYDDKTFQVGEFSNDVPANAENSNPIFLKMIRPSQLRPTYNNKTYPVWDLMMKNIYSIAYGLSSQGFRMQVMYETGTKAGKINFLPETKDTSIQNIPLLQLSGLDRLTNNTAPEPDNLFDFVDNLTVIPQKGVIIFPHIEPFGSYLSRKLNNPNDSVRYAFQPLYDMTYQDAIQYYPQLNRYTLEGVYQGGGGPASGGSGSGGAAEIPLNAFGVNPQSVIVTANGVRLNRGTDYDIDPSGSKVIIKNPAYLAQGQQLSVTFDQQQAFQMQTKTMSGLRVEYSPLKNTKLGFSGLQLNERPTNFKTTIGDEPVKNTLWGFDLASQKELPGLTKILDKLPLLNTKAPSSYNFSGEWAQLRPGQPRQVMQDSLQGITYIDDFEAAKMPYSMMGIQRWKLASFPRFQPANRFYNPETDFPNDSLAMGYSRAQLSWYQIDPQVYNPDIAKIPTGDKDSSYTRPVTPYELFPQITALPGAAFQPTFDLHYFPAKRGPYNYQTDPSKLSVSGRFLKPKENWAGIMAEINTNIDFEAQNVEFIEFWMMDPFLDKFKDSTGGELYLHLGNVSEDVIPDNLQFFENGLPEDGGAQGVVDTDWGKVPTTIPPSNAFSNNADARGRQDVGLDGLSTDEERNFFQPYLDKLSANFGTGSPAYDEFLRDPSSDDYKHFLSEEYNDNTTGILDRYARTFGTEGNSPVNQTNNGFTLQASQYPDTEDLNRNGTPNTWEEYWEYRIKVSKDSLIPGANYIVDKITSSVKLNNSGSKLDTVTWYQFRIPIRMGKPVNNIPNFKVINFMRMCVTGFESEAILRLTEFQTVATQWRKYDGIFTSRPDTFQTEPQPCETFDVGSVSVQDNSRKTPFNYVIPPGVFRQGFNGNTQPGFLQDERSLVIRATCLPEDEGRGIFKYVNQDFRNFKKLRMWVHAEAVETGLSPSNFNDRGDAVAFIRLGLDNDLNYYEYEIPLLPSDPNSSIPPYDTANIWRNQFNFDLDLLTTAKNDRNNTGFSSDERYEYNLNLPLGHKIYIKGTPKLSDIRNIMIGVRNPKTPDEGPVNVELWVNELSLTKFDNASAWAANANLNLQLADLGTIQASFQERKAGFGTLDQRVSQRKREDVTRYSVQGDFQLHKFIPEKWGISLPVHINYDEQFKNPQFDPREADVLTSDLYLQASPAEKRLIKSQIMDYTRNKGISFNNIKKNKTGTNTKNHIWDIENFDMSFAYSEMFNRNYMIEKNFNSNYRGAINYRYNIKSEPIQPFKKWKKKNPISEFNFSPLPKSVTVSLIGDRQFSENLYRPSLFGGKTTPVYTKNFLLTRNYNLAWDLTKSLAMTFTAANNARVDEVKGYWENSAQWQRDSIGSLQDNFLHFGRDTITTNGFKPNGQSYEYNRAYNRMISMGRNIGYNHNVNLAYTLPFSKFKPTNWITGNATYSGTFQWMNPPEVNMGLGATIINGQNINGSARADFNSLYGKWKGLKKMLDPLPYKPPVQPPKGTTPDPKAPKKDDKTGQPSKPKVVINPEWKDKHKLNPPKELKFLKAVLRSVLRVVFSVKNVDGTYTQTAGTTLPGYLPQTDNFGLDFGYTDTTSGRKSPIIPPTLGFLAGMQKDIRPQAERNSWITKDSTLSNYFMQNINSQLTLKSSLEPVPGFKIDLNATRNSTDNNSEMFRWDNASDDYIHTAKQFSGIYSVSYIFANTAFAKDDSLLFLQFAENRKIVSQRLYDLNPSKSALTYQGQRDGFQNGYTGSSQDVLIPALLGSYGLVKSEKVGLSPFPKMPLPNWNINFNPTIAFPQLKQTFTSISVKHSYQGTYSVGGYNRNIFAIDRNGDMQGDTAVIIGQDPLGNNIENFAPIRNIAMVQITERFAPLIGFNATLKNGMTTNLSYGRGRMMSFNMGNLQLTEEKNQDLTFSMGYKKDKLNLNLNLFGKDITLKNSANFNCQVTMRDSRVRNRTLDGITTPDLRGNLIININPSIDYIINNRVNIKVFWQENISRPHTSLSFPNSFRSVGVQMRLSLN